MTSEERRELSIGLVVGVILAALVMLLFVGCSTTCPPCVPEHEIVEVITPVYNCPASAELPPLVLPEWPVLAEDATPEQIKTWYVDMLQTYRARIEILRERVDALDTMLEAYRE